MEMYQVRYFLSVARTLNFTRAAEDCDVAQPSLSRAIKQLEAELGGELFRRERPQAILTELGHRMLPILTRCYESANNARALAAAVKKGEAGALRVALSPLIDLGLLLSHVEELGKIFDGLALVVRRGSAAETLEFLKTGDAEIAIAAATNEDGAVARALRPFQRGLSFELWPHPSAGEPGERQPRRSSRGAIRPAATRGACRGARRIADERRRSQLERCHEAFSDDDSDQARGRRCRCRPRAA